MVICGKKTAKQLDSYKNPVLAVRVNWGSLPVIPPLTPFGFRAKQRFICVFFSTVFVSVRPFINLNFEWKKGQQFAIARNS